MSWGADLVSRRS